MEHKELKRILYAEDENDIREIAQIALEELGGFSVEYYENGKALLHAAHKAIPDLLLLDVMMPEMDGPTALRELRKLPDYATIPAVFMTAKIQTNEVEEYQQLGVIDVIPKPFDPLTLAERIKEVWKKHYG